MYVKRAFWGKIRLRVAKLRISSQENLRGNSPERGRLHVHAWFFEIGTGTVYNYSPDREQFVPIRYEGK